MFLLNKNTYPLRDFRLEFQEMIRSQVKLFRLSLVTLFTVDSNSSKIIIYPNGSRKTFVYAIFVVFLIWLLLTSVNLLSRLLGIDKSVEYTVAQKVLDFTWLSFYIANVTYRVEYFRKKMDLPYLINQFFVFETKATENGKHSVIPLLFITTQIFIIVSKKFNLSQES